MRRGTVNYDGIRRSIPIFDAELYDCNMKCVILAGGLGTRLREETEFKPKPLVEVGGKPIIWHLIKYYNYFGIYEFIICAGYKGEMLKKFFENSNDFKKLSIEVIDTGENSNTGERLRKIKNLIKNESFYCTYGDGLADIELDKLTKFFINSNKIVTLSSTRPISRFGVIEFNENSLVSKFKEKPLMDSWINIGFFVFKSEIFDYIEENSVLETDVLIPLTEKNEVMAFKHLGFWQPMDTYREAIILNELWNSGHAPWKKYLL